MMKKQYFLNAKIIDPKNSIDEIGGLIIGENGKIEAIGKKVNQNNIPSRTAKLLVENPDKVNFTIDKKSLNLKSLESINENINFPDDLLYSIQFFSDTKYENVNNYLKKIINSKETIYQIQDFYILALSTEIGIDYFLIYKNFDTREEAQHYCSNYLSKIENCLIVDTTKF